MSLNGAVGATIVVDPVTMPDSLSLPSYYLEELKALMASLGVSTAMPLPVGERPRVRHRRAAGRFHRAGVARRGRQRRLFIRRNGGFCAP